jgi:hypothetical protein
MDSSYIFLTVIGLVVLITYLSTCNFQVKENFTTCPQNKYRKQTIMKKEKNNSSTPKKVRFSEDEDINYHSENPLKPRIVREPKGWKTFFQNKFLKGSVKEDTNFEGTQIRNYLDNIQYFHN